MCKAGQPGRIVRENPYYSPHFCEITQPSAKPQFAEVVVEAIGAADENDPVKAVVPDDPTQRPARLAAIAIADRLPLDQRVDPGGQAVEAVVPARVGSPILRDDRAGA